jgi:DNA-binding transcriptional MerR regulator/methylmalonyl-CoA mutase cobalamin-binding subunit
MSTTPQAAIADASGELFPIRTVSHLTGVNAITLRAWERRYGLVRPVRTATGHRLYRREEIDLIHRVVALLDRGIAISQVNASLRQPSSPTTLANFSVRGATPWERFRERMVTAITRFDEDDLEDVYNEALALHTIEQVTQHLLVPLLQQLGKRWESTEGTVSEEHFFGVYLRNKLGARYHHRSRRNRGPRVLAACLPGEHHEAGLLLFALAVHERGMQPVLLGANMPLEELAVTVKRARCEAIALSGSLTPEPAVLANLQTLARTAGVPVFVGGMTSVREHSALVDAGAVPLGTDLNVGAQRIQQTLSSIKPIT